MHHGKCEGCIRPREWLYMLVGRTRGQGANRVDDDDARAIALGFAQKGRSEEHTSELQSRLHLVCRLLLEKKKTTWLSASALFASAADLHGHEKFKISRGRRISLLLFVQRKRRTAKT